MLNWYFLLYTIITIMPNRCSPRLNMSVQSVAPCYRCALIRVKQELVLAICSQPFISVVPAVATHQTLPQLALVVEEPVRDLAIVV